ncbi:MAG: BsuPI-related putative proteinase inhibitor [Chthoniobacterales bacterium]
MKRTAVTLLVAVATMGRAFAQGSTPAPQPEERRWFGRIFHPFHSDSLPDYKDPRLHGLVLELRLSPQPVKLSEVRRLDVNMALTNRSKRPVALDFPTAQRIEICLRSSAGEVLTQWSDNHAFAEEIGTVLINPREHIEYAETIATRDLAPNKVFIAEVFFPQYPELRIRQKFLTAP